MRRGGEGFSAGTVEEAPRDYHGKVGCGAKEDAAAKEAEHASQQRRAAATAIDERAGEQRSGRRREIADAFGDLLLKVAQAQVGFHGEHQGRADAGAIITQQDTRHAEEQRGQEPDAHES